MLADDPTSASQIIPKAILKIKNSSAAMKSKSDIFFSSTGDAEACIPW